MNQSDFGNIIAQGLVGELNLLVLTGTPAETEGQMLSSFLPVFSFWPMYTVLFLFFCPAWFINRFVFFHLPGERVKKRDFFRTYPWDGSMPMTCRPVKNFCRLSVSVEIQADFLFRPLRGTFFGMAFHGFTDPWKIGPFFNQTLERGKKRGKIHSYQMEEVMTN